MKITDYKLKKEDIHRLINYATKVPSHAKAVRDQFRKNLTKAILAAFAFVIALVWRDVIRDTVSEIIKRAGIEGTGYVYTIISAFFVTFICVMGILLVSKTKKEEVKK